MDGLGRLLPEISIELSCGRQHRGRSSCVAPLDPRREPRDNHRVGTLGRLGGHRHEGADRLGIAGRLVGDAEVHRLAAGQDGG